MIIKQLIINNDNASYSKIILYCSTNFNFFSFFVIFNLDI